MNLSSTGAQSRSRWFRAFVGLACIDRLIHLDANPRTRWVGYITNKGHRVGSARSLALFGNPNLCGLSKMPFVLSPGFQRLAYVVFQVAGVSFFSTRLLTSAMGAGVLLLSAQILKRHSGGFALMVELMSLASEPLMFGMSRVAVPEVPVLRIKHLKEWRLRNLRQTEIFRLPPPRAAPWPLLMLKCKTLTDDLNVVCSKRQRTPRVLPCSPAITRDLIAARTTH